MESPKTTSEMEQVRAGTQERPVWSSQTIFIIATIAGVVGLGNIWRFPYMVGENGGGTFILAYAICILGIGFPIMVLETSVGNLTSRGPWVPSGGSAGSGARGPAGSWSPYPSQS
ncbi:MAG: hypothetical protein FI717_10200 [SAR202 cluster bacterium]|nr:hypothetical protein [SAR202 cluster bacterium]